MAGSRRVVIEFIGQDKSLGKTADGLGNKTSTLGGRLSKFGKVAALGFGVAAVAAAGMAVTTVKSLARIEQINAQTEAAIKSTGGAAGVSGKHIETLAGSLEKLTATEAESVQEGENLLLTFTNIQNKAGDGNKIFDEATAVMVDMSRALGQDTKTSAIQLGKALNDPIKGVSALQKVGVSFTDQQKEQIKTLVESGDTLGAQKIILKELNAEFGGSGAAYAETAAGKYALLGHKFGEIAENIMADLMPALVGLADWLLGTGLPAVENFAGVIKSSLGTAIEWVRGLFSSNTNGMAADVSKNFAAIKATFRDAISIITSLWGAFGPTLIAFAQSTFNNLRTIIGGGLQVIAGIFKVVSSLLKGDWKGVWEGIKQILRGAVAVLKGLVGQMWTVIKAVFRAGGVVLRAIFRQIWAGIKSLAAAGINSVLAAIRSVPGRIRAYAGAWRSAGRVLIQGFVNGMKNAAGIISGIAGNVWSAVKSLLNGAIARINSALQINIDKGPIHIHFGANIPYLAKGGVVKARNGGTLALLGEGGHDEAVIPLSGPHAPGLTNASSRVAPQAVAVIQLLLDGKMIQQSLLKRKRDGGIELGLA